MEPTWGILAATDSNNLKYLLVEVLYDPLVAKANKLQPFQNKESIFSGQYCAESTSYAKSMLEW